jgi:uncharacterized membrane protein
MTRVEREGEIHRRRYEKGKILEKGYNKQTNQQTNSMV